MPPIYRNRTIINQRGASIDIDNTTNIEKIQLSHRSGSNININSNVTSELATNNKQTTVVHDEFETVGNDKTEYVAKNDTKRVGENTYELKGFINQEQIDAHDTWKELFRPIANLNSQFKIQRGGVSFPAGSTTNVSGTRATNPVVGSKVYTVENKFNGYSGVPTRYSNADQVSTYVKVPDHGKTKAAAERSITVADINKSAGIGGSQAPGVLEFGANVSAATEGGTWSANNPAQQINNAMIDVQDELNSIEQQMGNGGDEILLVKRNKMETVGVVFNDYPSVRIDEKGRSQPLEMLVADSGTFKNHDYIPHVEEIDNGAVFPCGEETKVIGNKYNLLVGSGGINFKSTGVMELGGSTLKTGFKKINLNASHGIHIGSEASVELQSIKTITFRTNRQVFVDGAFGIKNNLIVGGGSYVEGETYVQHITAPLEVQQTEDTTLLGKFATDSDRTLFIAECKIGGNWYPVFAKASDDLIINYPHSHHFNNIPLRLCEANTDVRKLAEAENINKHNTKTQSLAQNHEKKLATKVVTQIRF